MSSLRAHHGRGAPRGFGGRLRSPARTLRGGTQEACPAVEHFDAVLALAVCAAATTSAIVARLPSKEWAGRHIEVRVRKELGLSFGWCRDPRCARGALAWCRDVLSSVAAEKRKQRSQMAQRCGVPEKEALLLTALDMRVMESTPTPAVLLLDELVRANRRALPAGGVVEYVRPWTPELGVTVWRTIATPPERSPRTWS